ITIGILLIILGILGLFLPLYAAIAFFYFLAIGLFINGAINIYMGASRADYPGWLKGLSIAGGLIAVILSIIAMVFPSFGVVMIMWLLGISLIATGVIRIAIGARKPKPPEPGKAPPLYT
ncbi:MAG: DUF308 domain-containing protein, partial [Candidatus Odinarchaeia archaeon]